MKIGRSHLSYCTNIHPAETWAETFEVLKTHVLAVRKRLKQSGALGEGEAFAIGLRLSAVASRELLTGEALAEFRKWLEMEDCYVFTINGFPFGSFHGERVKERVFQPDWTKASRMEYTKDLFRILAVVARRSAGASVSTLPGSHKTFAADEAMIMTNLAELAVWLDELAAKSGIDFHLGLEPEPLGHFENTAETLAFFERLRASANDPDAVGRRIGVNYDACHFALEYDAAGESLNALHAADIRISKIHLSAALALDPSDQAALAAVGPFDEPVYFHQVLLRRADGEIQRFADLPLFYEAASDGVLNPADFEEMRVHFHIPLDAEPAAPLLSTRDETEEVLRWRRANPDACGHYEIETYTWGVLPAEMQRPVDEQIAGEYAWVLARL